MAIPIGSKFSNFPPANPALPIDLVGIQEGKNVRTTLVNPVFEDANGLVELTSVDCTDVVAVSVDCNTLNGATPVTALNIDSYIAAYLAAHP